MFLDEKAFRSLKPYIGEKADILYREYIGADAKGRADIERDVLSLQLKCLKGNKLSEPIILEPPSIEEAQGELPVGMVAYGDRLLYPFGLRTEELLAHVGIFGRTGGGKTHLIRLLLDGLMGQGVPFLLFDWQRSYRKFGARPGVITYTVGREDNPFAFNPLDRSLIPASDLESYHRELVSVVLNTYYRGLVLLSVEGTEGLLLEGIQDLERRKMPLSFPNLRAWMGEHKGQYRERDWKTSTMNVLRKLTTGPIGKVFQQGRSFPVSRLLGQNTIFDMHGLGNAKDKSFFAQSLLLALYYHLIEEGQSQRLLLEIVIEEAHNVLLA